MPERIPWWRKTAVRRDAYLAILFIVGAYWPIRCIIELPPVALRDFGTFWVSGRAIRAGIDPYDVSAFKSLGDALLGKANYNFTYPPHTLFLFFPLSYLPPIAALVVWNLASAIFLWWAAKPWVPKGLPPVIALVVPGALLNYNYGQTGVIYAALFLLAFRPNGVAAALLTFKPQLGILVAPAVLRERRAIAIAFCASLVLLVGSNLVFGNWAEFVRHARDVQGKNLANLSQPIWMIKGTTPAIGYGLWGWAVFAAGAIYILFRNYNVFTAATAAFLISPYGLHYDMAALCLGFAIVLYSRWEVMPTLDKVAASLSFLSPVIVVFATTWVIPPILLWGLAIQTRWTDGIRLQVVTSPQRNFPHLRWMPLAA